jgi:hypothetical protein
MIAAGAVSVLMFPGSGLAHESVSKQYCRWRQGDKQHQRTGQKSEIYLSHCNLHWV